MLAPPALVLPLFQVRKVPDVPSSDIALGVILVLAGLLLGAYGRAGRMPVITVIGILAVIAGVLHQFSRAAGLDEAVAVRGRTTVIWIALVLAGTIVIGAGQRLGNPVMRGVAVAVGVLVLAACGAALLLAVLRIDGPIADW